MTGSSLRVGERSILSLRPLLAALAIVAAALAISASPASALSKHTFSTSFAGEGANALSHPTDVAVEQSTGDLYVVDNGNHRVEKFTPSGEFIFMVGQEVDKTNSERPGALPAEEDLCTAASGDVCQPARTIPGEPASGIGPGKLANPLYLAVDNSGGPGSGDFYVASVELSFSEGGRELQDYLTKFDPEGHLVTSWQAAGQLLLAQQFSSFIRQYEPPGSEPYDYPTDIAVDRQGNLYLVVRSYFRGEGNLRPAGTIYRLGPFGAVLGSAGFNSSIGRIAPAPPGGLLATQGEAVHFIDPTANDLGALTGPGFGKPPTALAFDLSTEESYVADAGTVIRHYGPQCEPSAPGCAITDSFGAPDLGDATGLAIDESTGVLYAADAERNRVAVFGPAPNLPDVLTTQAQNRPTSTAATLFGELRPAGAGDIEQCRFEYGTTLSYSLGTLPCLDGAGAEVGTPSVPITTAAVVHADLAGLTPETTYHYRLYAGNANGSLPGHDRAFVPHYVIGLTTDPPTGLSGEAATLNGSLLGDATDTHYYFEWGKTTAYGHNSPALPGADLPAPVGPGTTALSFGLSGLEPSTTYHYRLRAENQAGQTSIGLDREFTTPADLPAISGISADEVFADTALLQGQINPGAGDTVYHAEFGTEPCSQPSEPCQSTPRFAGHAGNGSSPVAAQVSLSGLQPDTLYHYRLVAENTSGQTKGLERTFSTLPALSSTSDPCPNAHVRQQTGAAQLLDCRAYELVSAPDAAGYDVESNLLPGQTPFAGYPQVDGRVLYGVHSGGIPGTDHPTNRGLDPYVAVRGEDGWSTAYVGVPANDPFAAAPFSSLPSGADSSLETFAFGASEGCSPCFAGGYTGIPLRLPGGQLTQGMVSSGITPPGPSAEPDGYIAQDLSANGEHFLFSSTTRFAPGGNDQTGDVSIYDRNLQTGQTQVVSNAPGGGPLACLQGVHSCHSPGDAKGIAGLAISKDGSRILLAQKLTEDSAHNAYYHLYMDVGDSSETIDLTPGTTSGVLFDGITEGGSKVFFTTKDQLLPAEDADESPDIYEAELNPQGTAATLRLVSDGPAGPSNSDACHPVANSGGPHWNAIGSAENCGAVAIGGGGGIASAAGSIYFLSPENLTAGASCGIPCSGEEPVPNQPNLYLAAPGSAPRFIATLEFDNPLVLDTLSSPEVRHTADFQTTPDGDFAAFPSTLPLAGADEETDGHTAVFRYDAPSEELTCISCPPSGAVSNGDSGLAPNGLSLTDGGRVFFTSHDALAAADTDHKQDVYEWEAPGAGACQPGGVAFNRAVGACIGLISAGTSAFDSGLLSATANATDAYFFTRDSLAPTDENGPTMKIYDAREEGGFPFLLPQAGCRASDECHGAASPPPPPLENGAESGTPHNYEAEPSAGPCPKGKVRRHGTCVPKHHKPHHTHHHKRGHK